MKNLFTIVLSLLFTVLVFPQQMAVHNLYHYNLSLINPAASAYSECKTFTITDRHQWTSVEGAPSLQTLNIQIPKRFHDYKKHGYGLNIVRDLNGAVQNLGSEFIYSYHITLKTINPNYLSFGLSAKFGQYSFDESNFNPNIYDPIIHYGSNNEWYYNFATGVMLRSEKYYAGIGVYNLFPYTTELYQGYGNESFFTTLIFGFNYAPKRYKFNLVPSLYFASDYENYQVDLTNKIILENGIWSGICLRKYFGTYVQSSQNALLFFGYNIGSWDIAYTYDLGLNALQRYHYGSHQIAVSYAICRKKYACPAY